MANLFKQKAHYVFNYKPRFYDARKERLEALEKKYSKEKKENAGKSTSTNFREAWKKSKAPSRNNANIKTAMIIVILVFLVYRYFKYIGITFF
ncbi:MAG: hypothetical protein L3J45_07600 [Flavobacteriaceae bacterium]|nr:hypothetical protein [Flavobacteriaceae bacterium]